MTQARPAGVAASREVRVWTVLLGGDAPPPSRPFALSEEERDRAARFRFEKDRNRFVATRLALREILGRRLGIPPARVAFSYGPHGKPALADHGTGIEFNVSHREDVALVAMTTGRRIGVDVERMTPVSDSATLAARFFSSREAESLRGLAPEARDEGFFACWTRKEALVKALGAGLSLPLASFSVSLEPGKPPALLAWEGREAERGLWSFRSWAPVPGYLAALAVEGTEWRLRRVVWRGSPAS